MRIGDRNPQVYNVFLFYASLLLAIGNRKLYSVVSFPFYALDMCFPGMMMGKQWGSCVFPTTFKLSWLRRFRLGLLSGCWASSDSSSRLIVIIYSLVTLTRLNIHFSAGQPSCYMNGNRWKSIFLRESAPLKFDRVNTDRNDDQLSSNCMTVGRLAVRTFEWHSRRGSYHMGKRRQCRPEKRRNRAGELKFKTSLGS